MSDRSAEELERDAERIRDGIVHSAEGLRYRTRPGRMADEVARYQRDTDNSVVLESVKRQIRDKPMALALVAAGMAWLMFGGRGGHRPHGYDTGDYYYAGYYPDAPYRGEVREYAVAKARAYAGEGDYAPRADAGWSSFGRSAAARSIRSHIRAWAGARHTSFDADLVVREVEAFDRGRLRNVPGYSPEDVRRGLVGVAPAA